jgi:bifunctional non-homologous end joining protein LigD
MAKLTTYRRKRDFGKTKEPRGKPRRVDKGHRYVIQKHDATRLHYDLRLELDGVMLSWAVTRGPSLVPDEKRLAIHVEDHPIEYNKFEGTIPKGEYGGGTVMIWDRGTWHPEHDPHKGMAKGHLDFTLEGEKLKGRWHLVRMRQRPGERQKPWLLIKSEDEFAQSKSDPDVLEEKARSAATGRTMDEIATSRKRIWHSNRPSRTSKAAAKPARRVAKAAVKAAAHRGDAKLPGFVPPALASLSSAAPSSTDWVHEIKFDGYRIQARIDGERVKLLTRNGLDWTKRFPTIARACATLASHRAILDGEVVSGDERGVSDFSALQDNLKSGRQDRLVYYVFDLLHLDGEDLTGKPLIERRRLLRKLVAELPKDDTTRFSDDFEVTGSQLLEQARRLNLEGIISKRRTAPYRSGRGGDWLKTKCTSNQEFVIVGYEPSDKKGRAIRSLLLAYYDSGDLRYAGRVGTGWGERAERDLETRLDALAAGKPPIDEISAVERRHNVKWVEPKLVAEIDFRGWTGDQLVRQGSFQGLREDKKPSQVVREVSRPPGEIKPRQAALRQRTPTKIRPPTGTSVDGVKLTHPDRMYWPEAGITKAMLADYYTKVWDRMRSHVAGRVVALLRCPEGYTAECFFQKHASAGLDERHLVAVKEPDGEKSIAIDSLEGVIVLVQAGVLEIHVRGSTAEHLEQANRLVFDLDPGPGVSWKDVVAAAREVRELLTALKLESFVKTTGGKGLHVVVPIKPTDWAEAKDFCRRIAESMAREAPGRFTATAKKAARNNRIFVDYLRNSREATAVAPYSTRARPGAAVSTPLTWEELGKQKTPNAFTVENLPKRLAKMKRDPWQDIARVKQPLPRLR